MGIQHSQRVVENLRKQLSVAVRSVQWSYAIFWSLSTTQQGTLEWRDGYYNGDIRTRKTVPAVEVCVDKLGLQRSEQLRELYGSLLEGDSDSGSMRPAVLSPEDLSDLEWYYLVCMSFTFNVGQGLPGKAFSTGQSVWLCNAEDAESKQFSRSLLAKSASVKTVICFPHMGGVTELGVTDLVPEDPDLIQHVKTSLLEFAKPFCTANSSSHKKNAEYDNDRFGVRVPEMNDKIQEPEPFTSLYPVESETKFHEEMLTKLDRSMSEELNIMGSSDDCSNDCCRNNHDREDSFMLEGQVNGLLTDSAVQSWHIAGEDDNDDDLSHCIQDSFNSSGCISQAFMWSQKTTSTPMDRNINDCLLLRQIQDFNDTKFGSLDLGNEDVEDFHYKRILSVILQRPHGYVNERPLCSYNNESSSFAPWKKETQMNHFPSLASQSALKKILFSVPLIIATRTLEPPNNDGKGLLQAPQVANDTSQLGFSGNRRENDKYLALRNLVPSVNKVDKASILNETIDYLKELEARVGELESCVNRSEPEAKARRKYLDVSEQTSDNYDNKRRSDGKMYMNKRKAGDVDETTADPQLQKGSLFENNTSLDLKVMVSEEEVVIEMRCPWREFLLLDIMDAVNSLSLDAHTVQSSTVDGMLILYLKSKFRGAAFASAGMIKQAMRRMVVGFC